jgi:hypothetical protein
VTRAELGDAVSRGDKDGAELLAIMDAIPRMPFADELEECMTRHGLDLKALLKTGDYTAILRYLLTSEGLGYAQKPKALIPFHRYPTGLRNPFEEHLLEGSEYCGSAERRTKVHFTVSQESLLDFKKEEAFFKKKNGERGFFEVTFSAQQPSTSTLAVDEGNRPFRGEKGQLVFRPGGHGALLSNLNDVQGDLVYIKNIDNVVGDKALGVAVRWKKILGGSLVLIQEKVFSLLERLGTLGNDAAVIDDIARLVREELLIDLGASFAKLPYAEKVWRLKTALERPIRVCGVVRNMGEPGGGPFWVRRSNGKVSLQIVESAQIDPADKAQREIFGKATHFNPVDLVCGLRDRKGKSYDLPRYSDLSAVFISRKSVNGRNIKALELPGLWNGSMSDWTTVFIEVPLETFSPVKTVLDLLKPAHQG